MNNEIIVAAAIIERNSQILICKRPEGKSCAGLWEFPGGKKEPGETLSQCAQRECMEEMGVAISVDGIYAQYAYRYGDAPFCFTFFLARITAGRPVCREHADIRWVKREELFHYEFCPADVAVVRALAEDR